MTAIVIGSRAAFRGSVLSLTLCLAAHAQVDDAATDRTGFSFAVVGTATANERATTSVLRAIGDSPARFTVHFETGAPNAGACAEPAIERRRALLDASPKPVVPVVAAVEWADCPSGRGDAMERLERVDDLLFNSDQSLGQARLPWLRQSAVARFRRYRENLRWQVGPVLFATLNLPADNNGFRFGAGRNGEFEERIVANRAWLERTFRLAAERRLAGIVLFVDGAPHVALPLRAPDPRQHERDGYYEFKVTLRDLATTYRGKVLLVQGQWSGDAARPSNVDRPFRDASGKPLDLLRIAVPHDGDDHAWMRVDVDPGDRALFRVVVERVFDDPSGELYGMERGR